MSNDRARRLKMGHGHATLRQIKNGASNAGGNGA